MSVMIAVKFTFALCIWFIANISDRDCYIKPKKDDNLLQSIFGTIGNVGKGGFLALKQLIQLPANFQDLSDGPFFTDYKDKTMAKIVSDLGYPLETYKVQTKDGYILTLFRIPNGKNSSTTTKTTKPVVFLQHGLVDSGSLFVLNYYAYQNLATVLADLGYDVWIGNFRGCRYSQEHVSLSTKDPKFWEFSWDEMGLMDMPAMIDYALKKSGQSKMSYVGFSMGAAAIFALLSTDKTYQSKINIVAAVSPGVRTSNTKGPILQFYQFANLVQYESQLTGTKGQFLPYLPEIRNGLAKLCATKISNLLICESILQVGLGITTRNLNKTLIPFMVTQIIDETSVNTFKHYTQQVRDETFQKYDYGKETNLKKYGQKEPPMYKIQNVDVPVGIFSSTKDSFVTQPDIKFLNDVLPNVVENIVLNDTINYSHFDLVIAQNANSVIYPSVIALLDKYKEK